MRHPRLVGEAHKLAHQVNSSFERRRRVGHDGQTGPRLGLVHADELQVDVRLPLAVLLPRPELPGRDQVVGARLLAEVQQPGAVSSN